MWLAETPLAVVRACLVMQPRLEAEEAIARVNQASVAAGTVDGAGLRAHWTAQAAGPDTARLKADPSVLEAHGIPVRRVPKTRPA